VTAAPEAIAARARRRAGMAMVVASALSFGAMAILARIALASGVDTLTLLALRFAFAATLMLLIARVRGATWPRGRMLGIVVAMGAIGYGGQAFTFLTGLTLAPAGLIALLLYLHPAMVAVLSAIFLHERLTASKLAALAIALAGMLLTVAPTLAGAGVGSYPDIGTGISFGVAAAAIYAVYIVIGARIGRTVAALPMATIVIASAGAVFVAAALAHGPQWPATVSGWLAILGIAVVSTVIAITLFFGGLERIGPTRASTLSTIEPLFTVLLAAAVLDESIALQQLFGGALILAAVIMLARAGERPQTTGSRDGVTRDAGS
jgi:drug/metabolite transporter (DMT)-like permease